MITYHCYKTCPICGKTTLRLIEGTAERGLWECEGKFHPAGWAIGCPGRVDEREDRLVWKSIEFALFERAFDPLPQSGTRRERKPDQTPDLEAKKREFWEWVAWGARTTGTEPCKGCPAYSGCDDSDGDCGDTLRAYYERLGGGK